MTMPGFLVVGGAGFIGSFLVERLIERGYVTVLDDFSTGRREFLSRAVASGRCDVREGSVFDAELLRACLRGKIAVFHCSANSEARLGLEQPGLDVEQGTLATHAVLDAMRREGVRGFVLPSSAAVYGNRSEPCAEGDLGALPVSLYAASKLASEALLSAHVECFGVMGWIFRLGNVVGPRATHGAPVDFLRRLKATPDELSVLGNGSQSKPYVYVADAVDAMLFGFENAAEPLNIFNVAPDDTTSIKRIAELCVACAPNPGAQIHFGSGDRGWLGDVPRVRMDGRRLAELGYSLEHSSDSAVELGIPELAQEIFG